jgi:chaperonin cofactor prefoldin
LKLVNLEIEKKLQTINKKQDTIEKSVMDRNAKLQKLQDDIRNEIANALTTKVKQKRN